MNRLFKSRKLLYLILSLLLFSVFTLTLAYAALSALLEIQGNAHVSAGDWSINIINSSDGLGYTNEIVGGASYTNPTITGTTIANYTVSLSKPGDSISLYFDAVNNGDINATIASIYNSTPVCTSSTNNVADANLICNNLDITFTYFNGNEIKVDDILGNDAICSSPGDNLGIVPVLKLTLSLKDSMTSVPSSTVTVSNLNHEINFVQTDYICDPNMIGR